MGVCACAICGVACSYIIISIGNVYIRLCEKCYQEYKDKTISDLREDNETEKEIKQ